MIDFKYITGNNHEYPLQLYYRIIGAESVCFEPEVIRALCKSGCSNYGRSGGCPPRSPLFPSLIESNKQLVLVLCKFESIHKPANVVKSRNSAIHWKFQDGITARLLNKLGHVLVKDVQGKFLATGYCMGCPGKKCAFKLGIEQCRHPNIRTYSMESTGINVVETVENVFNMRMYWYKKGDTDVPYMLKCMAFIPSRNLEETNLDDIMMHALSSSLI